MLKEPRPGRVKTRLGAGIGMVPAAWWFRRSALALLRRLDDPRWRLWLAVSPDREGMASRVWPEHMPRLPQGQGNLGERMARIFRSLPPGPALIIGADIPGIAPIHIDRAYRALGHADAVIGPAPDGGFWLIGHRGTRALPAGLFKGVRWSSPYARTDTIASFPGWRVAEVDQLADVDTAADLAAAKG